MTQASYKQFCPVAMAAEVLCTRWTIVLLRELVAGSTRFNDLRRGVPRMSSALLAKRLKDLHAAGIVRRVESETERGVHEYQLTEAGRDLRAVVEAAGVWGQKWIEAEPSLENLDVSLLMWDMRRNIDPTPLPKRRSVIEFLYPELPAARKHWWLIAEPDGVVDLCSVDPGFEVDLYVTCELRAMTAVWMGLTTVADEQARDRITLIGDDKLGRDMQRWLGLSPFAVQKKLTADAQLT